MPPAPLSKIYGAEFSFSFRSVVAVIVWFSDANDTVAAEWFLVG